LLCQEGLQRDQPLQDIGCGSLRGGAALIAYLDADGYAGMGVRASVTAEARRELVREPLTGKHPELVCLPSLDELALDRQFDFVLRRFGAVAPE